MNAVPDFDRVRKRFRSIELIPYDPSYLKSALIVAREIHEHSIYRDMPLDEAKLIRQLSASGQTVPDRYFKLAVRDGRVIGGFYGCVLRVFFCDVLVAKDMGWWVAQEARGSAAAILLLADFEAWARAAGAVKCTIGQSGVENIERTSKLFEHCGYRLTGYNAAKEL